MEAEDRIHRVLREMPGAIRETNSIRSEALRQVFAMQRANILITAAIAKFALVSGFPTVNGTVIKFASFLLKLFSLAVSFVYSHPARRGCDGR